MRLKDLEGLEQEGCAERMHISPAYLSPGAGGSLTEGS